jgi:DNA-binding transcriptional LysR family regulator
MRTFAAIADAGSLTAAARALDGSLPAVVRGLAALEAELGVRLFQRTTRRISLTDTGRRYLERCRHVLSLVDEAEAELRAEQTEPQGKLTVTAPVQFGQLHVAAGLTSYLQRYPKVSAELLLLDRVVNLVEEGIDVAVRIGALEDSSLIAKDAGNMRRLTVASPAYLRRRGTPKHPNELAGHDCVRQLREGSSVWTFQAGGKPFSVHVRGKFGVNHVGAATDACEAGLGIGSFFAYQIAGRLTSGALRVVLAEFELPPRPIHIVYPEARLVPARTRLFIDWIKRHVAGQRLLWEPRARRPRGRQS